MVGEVLYFVHTLLISTTAAARPKAHIAVHSVLWIICLSEETAWLLLLVLLLVPRLVCVDGFTSFTSPNPNNAIHRILGLFKKAVLLRKDRQCVLQFKYMKPPNEQSEQYEQRSLSATRA
jgi:hypothetical protein